MYIEKRPGLKTCAYYSSKNSLAVLNVIYIFLAILLICIAVYAKITAVLTSLPILGAVVACGVFLLIISIFGLIGAVRHQLVILFFYMITLILIFLLSVSIAALTVPPAKQEALLRSSWQRLGNQTKDELQVAGNCCGFHVLADLANTTMSHPPCVKLPCCKKKTHNHCDECPACFAYFKDSIDQVLSVAGGVGLFFSFTLIFGVYVAYKYRNIKDPRSLSGSFL
ncbi:LOW QUALITY PROTEIN: tetraspanin-31-B-like [Dendronephthya gigantea]|uniref:LOW QUALITY PROTEIN: tetraspanin-31-B-like n=1 Tax=Dendronephthya gigantea TaxID=151771 RepID=UPI00106A3DB1|nr:LOW QUALITY PROTEIN: tetraspanin-31-B-like [Dendronephthya gigantea]